MDLQKVGARLSVARKRKGWSQEQLAEKVNLSTIYIGMVERGEKELKLSTFCTIINALDVSADEILFEATKYGFYARMEKYALLFSQLDDEQKDAISRFLEIADDLVIR